MKNPRLMKRMISIRGGGGRCFCNSWHGHLWRVSLEKDARSCIPDIETKKYCVDSSMRFGDFVDFIRKQIKHRGSLFVYVNDREPETDFLMYQVYANNIDKYGFLRMTYRGECRVCGLGNMSPRIVDNVAARSDIIPDMVKEGRKQNSTLIHS
ncbi:autophagy-related protein 8-like [Malus sylvestris]|uniref:autophagy-related protein 8-like n=1 Tax=Malus sylvestris TaxID=3752 RepID=UPI0021AC8E02|nr:autophagy-related protein 8-like [Malus sylvestris]